MTTDTADIALAQFNPASRALQATDVFYVYQTQYGEVALPASLILAFVQKYIGAGLFITNGQPDNETGTNGDYAIDLSTGNVFGPMTNGAWPTPPSTMIAGALTAALASSLSEQMLATVTANRAQLLLGFGAPSNAIGIPGQTYIDMQGGVIYGPFAGTAWPAGVNIVASSLTAALNTSIVNSVTSAVEAALAATGGAALVGYNATNVAAVLTSQSQSLAALQNAAPFKGTSAALGGSPLSAGSSISTTVAITGAAVGMAVVVTPTTYPGDGFRWLGYVSAAGVVTITVVSEVTGTPTSSTYNVRVIQ
jgi:hypothetical protein